MCTVMHVSRTIRSVVDFTKWHDYRANSGLHIKRIKLSEFFWGLYSCRFNGVEQDFCLCLKKQEWIIFYGSCFDGINDFWMLQNATRGLHLLIRNRINGDVLSLLRPNLEPSKQKYECADQSFHGLLLVVDFNFHFLLRFFINRRVFELH